MGFLSKLFKKGEEPATPCSDDVLGRMEWNEDDESWCGEFGGVKFAVAYDGAAVPSGILIAYAREVLAERQWLESSLADAKSVSENA